MQAPLPHHSRRRGVRERGRRLRVQQAWLWVPAFAGREGRLLPLWDEFSIVNRIKEYTRPAPQLSLNEQWQVREQILAYARAIEQVAAELQQIADDLRSSL